MNSSFIRRRFVVVAISLFVAALLAFAFTRSFTALWIVLGALAVLFLLYAGALHVERTRLNLLLRSILGGRKGVSVFAHTYPRYRFVDLFRAAEHFAEQFPQCRKINATYYLDLNSLLANASPIKIEPATEVPVEVDYNQQEYCPDDCFWCAPPHDGGPGMILRVRYFRNHDQVTLEIADADHQRAAQTAEAIAEWSIRHSIYRNKVIQVPCRNDTPDEYGYFDASRMHITLKFMNVRTVSADDIILGDYVRRTLERNIFDFYEHRDVLLAKGVPSKRAILFYGPPGTGKTYTSQYIYGRLRDVTTFVVVGESLNKIEAVCNLARMLQPSLVIMEDVDLIFTSREINLYSTALGDFMDQLDGFRADDQVTFILTTNAIERLEKAIKDRPGRINQCVYFGPPGAELREKYLDMYLRDYDATALDRRRLLALTDGVTQAFIKELVHRAVMVCLERMAYRDEQIQLRDDHFQDAFEELTQKNSEQTQSIIGFKVPAGEKEA